MGTLEQIKSEKKRCSPHKNNPLTSQILPTFRKM